jgi:hypothetical protein
MRPSPHQLEIFAQIFFDRWHSVCEGGRPREVTALPLTRCATGYKVTTLPSLAHRVLRIASAFAGRLLPSRCRYGEQVGETSVQCPVHRGPRFFDNLLGAAGLPGWNRLLACLVRQPAGQSVTSQKRSVGKLPTETGRLPVPPCIIGVQPPFLTFPRLPSPF